MNGSYIKARENYQVHFNAGFAELNKEMASKIYSDVVERPDHVYLVAMKV
jgi:hypothetical protein